MPIQTLGDLKSSIRDWMYDRADLVPVIPDFIALAQADLDRVLRLRRQIKTATLALDSNGAAALPSDYAQYREAVALTNPKRVLEFVAPTWADWAHPFDEAGLPRVFTIDGPSLIVRPKTQADVSLQYWAKLPALAADNDTNWLLQEHPGIYLYSALKHACIYIGDPERGQQMAGLAAGLVEALVNEDRVGMYAKAGARISRRGP